MPYHETPQFARVVQIANLSAAPLIATFLQPYQTQLKASANATNNLQMMPLTSLLSALMRNAQTTNALQLLEWVANMAIDSSISSIPPHRALLAFWTSTLVQFCVSVSGQSSDAGKSKSTTKLSDADAQSYLRILFSSSTSLASRSLSLPTDEGSSHAKKSQSKRIKKVARTWSETHVASCMVLSAIAGCFDVSLDASRAVLEELCQSRATSVGVVVASSMGTKAMLVVAYAMAASVPAPSNGKSQRLFSEGVIQTLLELPEMVKSVLRDLEQSDISGFLHHFLHGLILNLSSPSDTASTAALETLLVAPHLPAPVRSSAVGALASLPLSDKRPEHAPRVRILASLRQHRPDLFADAGVEPSSELLQCLLAESTVRTFYSTDAAIDNTAVSNSTTDDATWLGLHSSSASERHVALEALIMKFGKSGTTGSKSDTAALSHILLARIADDSNAVLKTLYDGGVKSVLARVAETCDIVDAITAVLAQNVPAGETVGLHLDFLLGTCLPKLLAAREIRGDATQRIFTRAVFPAVFGVDASRSSTSTAVQSLARIARPSAGAATTNDAWTELIWAAADACRGAEPGVKDLAKHNARVAKNLADAIIDASDHAAAVVGFLLRTARSDSAGELNAFALLTLATIAGAAPVRTKAELLQLIEMQAIAAEHFTPTSTPHVGGALLVQHGATQETLASIAHDLVDVQLKLLSGSSETIAKRYFVGDVSLEARLADALHTTVTLQRAPSSLLCTWIAQMQHAAIPRLLDLAHTSGSVATVGHLEALLRASHAQDFQTLVPGLLLQLEVPNERMRRAALATLAVIRGSQSQSVFAFDALYGPASAKLQYLQRADVDQLLDAVTEEADAFVHDAGHLRIFCAQRLAAAKGDARKEAAFKHATLCWLLTHAVAWPSLQGKITILKATAEIRSAVKLQILLDALQAQTEKFEADTIPSNDESQCLELLFAMYDHSARAALDEGSIGWRLLLDSVRSQNGASASSASQSDLLTIPILQSTYADSQPRP